MNYPRSLSVKETQQGRRVSRMLKQQELRFVLGNDPRLIAPFILHLLRRAAQVSQLDETMRAHLAISLEEALANALYHGNLELTSEAVRRAREQAAELHPDPIAQRSQRQPYCDRRIHVHASLSQNEARFVVRDEGPGFDPTAVADPTRPERLQLESGRGIHLMRALMDHVSFNPQGNAVTLVKRLAAA